MNIKEALVNILIDDWDLDVINSDYDEEHQDNASESFVLI